MSAPYVKITRAEINAFLRSAVILAMAKPEYINGGVRVVNVALNADGIPRLDFDNGDFIFLDFEHLVPRETAGPRIADAFYGAQCPAYPACTGGCGLGCTHEIESRRNIRKEAAAGEAKTCWQCTKCKGVVAHAGKPNFCPYCRSADLRDVGR